MSSVATAVARAIINVFCGKIFVLLSKLPSKTSVLLIVGVFYAVPRKSLRFCLPLIPQNIFACPAKYFEECDFFTALEQ